MRDDLIRNIADGLTYLQMKLKGRSVARLPDLSIASEDFVKDFLNAMFDLDLENLNSKAQPHPAIDLGDRAKRISFQVTTETGSRKINDTLKKFAQYNLHNQYDKVQFIILNDKQKRYPSLSVPTGIAFDPEDDIIDVSDLIRKIGHCRPGSLTKLNHLVIEERLTVGSPILEAQLQDIRDYMHISPTGPNLERQIIFRNAHSKNLARIYIGAYLLDEETGDAIVLYDEIKNTIQAGAEVRWGDVISGKARSSFSDRDVNWYGENLEDRLAKLLEHTSGNKLLVAACRAVEDSAQNTILAFWRAEHFSAIEQASWSHLHVDGTSLYEDALKFSDSWYVKTREQ